MPHKLYPSYLSLLESGELEQRAAEGREILTQCTLCPRECGINRSTDERGECQSGVLAPVYNYMAHHGEEKPLRGTRGSGTIFFSGCNLHCLYCQNADISQKNYGTEVEAADLAEMMLDLQHQGCHNINLVSPTHVVPQIIEALAIAAKNGLRLPLVYNTGGYDKLEPLQMLDGIVDIYMPDMKYSDEAVAWKYSGVKNYPAVNQAAIREMYRQVGDLLIDDKGIARRGLLIRHLVLPNGLSGSPTIISFIANEISLNTYLNIMDQYRPEYMAYEIPELNRRITREEFLQVKELAEKFGLTRLD